MAERLRVLAIAEGANPGAVGQRLIGWSLANALREVADVHLVTQIRNRPAIDLAGWTEGKDFTVIDSEWIARRARRVIAALRLGWTGYTAVNALTYPYFEHLVWKRFAGDLEAGQYDVVHRIIPVSPTTTSPLAAHCRKVGVPFVMGPVNGGIPWPKGFDAERRREREWLSYVRGAYRLMPGRRMTLSSASVILAGSMQTLGEIPVRYRDKCILIPENGIDPARFNRTAQQAGTLPLRACFVGRLVPLKGVSMLLEAAAPLLRQNRMTLEIVGDGPMMGELQEQARRLLTGHVGEEPAVIFYGRVPHDKVQQVVSECHVLTFPSIKEFGGGVVLEAMALGVVPIVMDYGGPGELVGPDTGFRLPMGSREEIVARLRVCLERVLADPAQLENMGRLAQIHVQEHLIWQAKARQMIEIYDWALGRREPRPMPFAAPHR